MPRKNKKRKPRTHIPEVSQTLEKECISNAIVEGTSCSEDGSISTTVEQNVQDPENLDECLFPQTEFVTQETEKDKDLESTQSIEVHMSSENEKAVMSMAQKQDKGINGKPITLISNYFPLTCKNITIFHYDIEIKFHKKEDTEISEKKKSPLKSGEGVKLKGKSIKNDLKDGLTHKEHQYERRPGLDLSRKIICKLFNQENDLRNYKYVYDGRKNLYTIKELPILFKEKLYITELEEFGLIKKFVVIIKLVKKTGGGNKMFLESLNNLQSSCCEEIAHESIMLLDTIMCHRTPQRGNPHSDDILLFSQIQVGKSFFNVNAQKQSLGQGLDLVFGYNQSVRFTEKGPAVIVNLAAKAFLKEGSAVKFASDVLNVRDLKSFVIGPSDHQKLNEAFSRVRIQVTHLPYPRNYTIESVTKYSAKETYQEIKGKKVSIAEYFETKYHKLCFQTLPCFKMKSSNDKDVLIPMEVCVIPSNQPKMGKLPPDITRNMIKETAVSPDKRFREIDNIARSITTNEISGDSMEKFGLSMELQSMKVPGRILHAPRLLYQKNPGNSTVKPDNCGKWRVDNNKFIKPKEFSWVLVSFADNHICSINTLKELCDILCRNAEKLGMSMRKPRIEIFDKNKKTGAVIKYLKGIEVNLAIIVLEQIEAKSKKRYEEIKSEEPLLHFPTQCIKAKTIQNAMKELKFKPFLANQKFDNILNKINAKLGGVNHRLFHPPEMFESELLILGADVIHSPRGFNCPSIASVVGSLDEFATSYAATCRIQYPQKNEKLSQEIILELNDMIEDILQANNNRYTSNSEKKLEKIIIFRDGISEGQFRYALDVELPLIKDACQKQLNYIPSITFIIVQKRHQTRLRPIKPEDGVGRGKNVPPGTVVDSDIVHPVNFDFFICSHEGIQGTSKPTHYTVLYDDNKFSSDELQKLCYYLCYLYVKCNRSISIPAPLRYADLSCTRAKLYVDNYLNETNQYRYSRSCDEKLELPEEITTKVTTMKNYSGMHYI